MWLIIPERKGRYVEVAQRGQDKRVMDPNAVGKHALQLWNDRSAHDGADQESGAFAGQRSEALNRDSKDAREHR